MNLNPHESRVLVVLATTDEDFCCYAFREIMSRVRLTRPVVRRACRSLARKGLAECHHGLFTEDGEMAGSGYCATDEGRKHDARP